MPSPDSPQGIPQFIFSTCLPESNAWLKRDAARLHPELRLAFSRPGFVSWKADGLSSDFYLQTPVAGVCGFGCGQVGEREALFTKLAALPPMNRTCLHVSALGQEASNSETVAQTVVALRSWLDQRGLDWRINVPARVDQTVIDVIVLEPERWFVGFHTQRLDKYSGPGGVQPSRVDEASPSRAYAKIAELLTLGELTLRPGDTVVELGASPGGCTLFMLQQGARVWAIDKAPLAPHVLAFGKSNGDVLTSLEIAAGEVTRTQLPKRVDYLVSDVNLAPAVSLRYLDRLCALVRGPRRGILVNIKINDEQAEVMLPTVLDRARALGQRLGLAHMRVAQLPSHRREVGVVLRRSDAT